MRQRQLQDGIGAIVLAGGAGTRMHGADKGWINWQGQPLIERVLASIGPQVSDIVISANRNLSHYRNLGYPVVADAETGYPGPLAGIAACAPHCRHRHTLIVPCDCPRLPDTLAQRLLATVLATGVRAAYAHDGNRAQYLCCLVDTAALPELTLPAQDRSVRGWLKALNAEAVDFSDCQDTFINVNSL